MKSREACVKMKIATCWEEGVEARRQRQTGNTINMTSGSVAAELTQQESSAVL